MNESTIWGKNNKILKNIFENNKDGIQNKKVIERKWKWGGPKRWISKKEKSLERRQESGISNPWDMHVWEEKG